MARGDETKGAHQGGASRAGVRSPLSSRDECAEPLRLEILWKPEGFPLRGPGPPRTDCVWGVASSASSGPGELLVAVIFSVRQDRVCIPPICLHRVEILGSFRFVGEELQQASVKAVVPKIDYIARFPVEMFVTRKRGGDAS